MPLPVSVLDLIPITSGGTPAEALASSFALAELTDALGYTRYWIAEHHNTAGLASSTPELVIALMAARTQRIRVGSGGIMLPNHSPLKVAETFRTLEALYPGRIDLGLGRAPGTDQLTAVALRRSVDRLMADDFPEQIQEMQAYAGEAPFPENSAPFHKVMASPQGVPLPPLWILSSSGYGAQLAAKLGRGLAFARHFSPEAALPSMRAYRELFQPSVHLKRPHSILTMGVVCADSEERAEELARCVDLMWLRFMRGERGPLATPEEARDYPYTELERRHARDSRVGKMVVGTPQRVREELMSLVESHAADELMVTSHISVPTERRASYQLLAKAFGLSG